MAIDPYANTVQVIKFSGKKGVAKQDDKCWIVITDENGQRVLVNAHTCNEIFWSSSMILTVSSFRVYLKRSTHANSSLSSMSTSLIFV